MSTTVSAREAYIDNLDNVLQLHDQLNAKLSSVETSSDSADKLISDARESLAKKLTGTNVASTVGSISSIVGGILVFTPFTLAGAALLVAGTATSAGSSVAKSFFFEKDAGTAFAQALNNYTASSNDMRNQFQKIEDGQKQLLISLAQFMTALHREVPSPSPGPGKGPANPNAPTAGGPSPFSLAALQGVISGSSAAKPWLGAGTKTAAQLADWLGKSGGTLGQVFGKTMPKLIKGLPVLSIAIDVVSIVSTWTGSNETLDKADKLRKEIKDGTEAYRQMVRQYLAALEEVVGNIELQITLRKLMRLRNARPGGPPGGGPPTDPDKPCGILAQLMANYDVPFLIFAILQGQSNDDSEQDDYVTELIKEHEVAILGQRPMTAAVIDSLLENYPEINSIDSENEDKEKEPQLDITKIGMFRLHCRLVHFSNQVVYNVTGSSVDKRVGSWVRYWKWWIAKTRARACLEAKCYIERSTTPGYEAHTDRIVGGHMEPDNIGTNPHWYILPICQGHNAPSGRFDRIHGRKSLVTKSSAWAVEIPMPRRV